MQCGAGTYSTDNYCVSCPIGSYQDEAGQSSCKKCVGDKSTLTPGSTACLGKWRLFTCSYSVPAWRTVRSLLSFWKWICKWLQVFIMRYCSHHSSNFFYTPRLTNFSYLKYHVLKYYHSVRSQEHGNMISLKHVYSLATYCSFALIFLVKQLPRSM